MIILTRDEIIQYSKLVNEAKLEELKRWQSLDCFVRMPRSKARNKVDGTWVLKWKKVRKEANGKNTWVRIIKARLTARGFKDTQAFHEKITKMEQHTENQLKRVEIEQSFRRKELFNEVDLRLNLFRATPSAGASKWCVGLV